MVQHWECARALDAHSQPETTTRTKQRSNCRRHFKHRHYQATGAHHSLWKPPKHKTHSTATLDLEAETNTVVYTDLSTNFPVTKRLLLCTQSIEDLLAQRFFLDSRATAHHCAMTTSSRSRDAFSHLFAWLGRLRRARGSRQLEANQDQSTRSVPSMHFDVWVHDSPR